MNIPMRALVIFIVLGSMLISASCNTAQSTTATAETQVGISESRTVSTTVIEASPQPKYTATELPSPTYTSTTTSTSTIAPTIKPTQSFTSTPKLIPTQTIASLVPGIYGAGGCNKFSVVKTTADGWATATFNWCVEYIEIQKNGSLLIVMSWTLLDNSENIIQVTKRSDVNNPNMYLTDNLGNRYDSVIVSGDAANDIPMEKGKAYYGTFTFRPIKPGAFKFTFHDDDNGKVISDIVLMKPSVYINELNLSRYPLMISYYSDKWTAGKNDQGGVNLTHLKYANCQVMEWEPGKAQGRYLNTVNLGGLSYDLYRTQETNYSLREYVLVGGLEKIQLTEQPLFHVTVPYDNSLPCLDDVSLVLGSLTTPSP